MPSLLWSPLVCRAILVGVIASMLVACLPLPAETPTPTPTATPRPTPTPTATPDPTPEPSGSPGPTPRPYALVTPRQRDDRHIRVTVAPNLATDGSGQIVVRVTNLEATRIQEIVVRWPTALNEHLFLAPFVPSSSRTCEGCPPLVQPWTKWVVGPGEDGEPPRTTSLGWGPLDAGATLRIPIIAHRRLNGPVSFDLQVLAGEALLRLEGGEPAWLRVSVP